MSDDLICCPHCGGLIRASRTGLFGRESEKEKS